MVIGNYCFHLTGINYCNLVTGINYFYKAINLALLMLYHLTSVQVGILQY